jgi:transposase
MGGLAFETYSRTQRTPALKPRPVVILDTLAPHLNVAAAQPLQDKSCWVQFLPPYSPNLDPVEMAFSKLKAHLRRVGARTFDQLFEAIGDICDMFSPHQCWTYLQTAGYASN